MTKQYAQEQLEKFQNYQRRYKGYPGSPGDDCLLHIYGYTVREERGYINRQVKFYKACIKVFEELKVEELTLDAINVYLWHQL